VRKKFGSVVFGISLAVSFFIAPSAYGQSGSPSPGGGTENVFSVDQEATCPSLQAFYARAPESPNQADIELYWASLSSDLMALMPSCLRSSEYFALLGAAQLNSDQNMFAIESLERALLLDPDSGAARIDYAQALFNAGQLFPAIEIGEELLMRDNLPVGLREEVARRNRDWSARTKDHSLVIDLSGGYDNNLNGAPRSDQITLTLSGEPITLSLGNDYRSVAGFYTNLGVSSQYRRLTSSSQSHWTNEVKGRLSGDERSDLVQFDSRYTFLRPSRERSLQVDGGLTHLLFGGSPLFSAAQFSGRYQVNLATSCDPSVGLQGQRQYFRQQTSLDGVEGRLFIGLSCGSNGRVQEGGSVLSLEGGLVRNLAVKSARPGGDRSGWQLSAQWQNDSFLAQISHVGIDDSRAYSSVLADGARRWVRRSQLFFQYRRPIQLAGVKATALFNFFHQEQESNINLFETDDTTIEFGLRLGF
jgi:hypothetical protein